MSGTRTLAQVRGKAENVAGTPGISLDLDMIHAMTARDNALVVDEAMSGSSEAFTYSFSLQGKMVQGVSVVGARHLAAHYGGLKHRLVASFDKTGALFTRTTYPGPGVPYDVQFQHVDFMAEEPDFYTVVIEVADVKSGLTEQVEITEARKEKKRDGTEYERPHFRRIAQSKAFRNGVLNILPQDFVQRFKDQSIASKNNPDLTKDWIEEIRDGIVRFSTGKGIPLNRQALASLDGNQLMGLRDAVKDGLETFKHSLAALGCISNVTPMREISMEQGVGQQVVDLSQKAAETVPVPGSTVSEEQKAQETTQHSGAAIADALNEEAKRTLADDPDAPPPVTNQGSSMRRIDLSNPPETMKTWVETYGVPEARRLAAKQGWELPAELAEALEASLPSGKPRQDEDGGPPPAPYDDEAPAGRGPGNRREVRTPPKGEARGSRRDESNGSGGGDLFPADRKNRGN